MFEEKDAVGDRLVLPAHGPFRKAALFIHALFEDVDFKVPLIPCYLRQQWLDPLPFAFKYLGKPMRRVIGS